MNNESDSSVPVADTHVAPTDAPSAPLSKVSTRKMPQWHAIPRLLGYARIAYLVGLVLSLLIVSPIDWIPTPLLKIVVFAIILAVTSILFVLGGGIRELSRAPGRWWALLSTLALPVAYLLSWWYSADRAVALIGVGNEVDTVLFITVAAITFLLGFGLFRTLKSVRQFVTSIGIAIIVAAVFQYFSIMLGSYLLPAMFADKSVNLIGKWNDFGMLVSIGILFLLARLELGDDEGWRRWVSIAGLVLLALLVVLVQFNFIWWFTIAGALAIGVLKWLPRVHTHDQNTTPIQMSRIPWFAGASVLVCVVFLAAGSAIAAHLPGFLSIPSLEVRPGISTTYDIASAGHSSFMRTVLGTGPNTFTNEWIINKPLSVNQTPFWNIDFLTGYSVASTAFLTTGILGLLALIVPIGLVVLSLWQLRKINHLPLDDRLLLLSLGLASAFLWVGIVMYAGSQDMILLAFATAGALWATEAAARRGAPASASAMPARRLWLIGNAMAAFVLIIVSVWPALAESRQLMSYSYEQKGSKALGAGDILGAAQATDESQSYEVTGDNLRLGISIDLAQMQKLAQASTTPATIDAMRTQFQGALQAAIAQAQKAIQINTDDYQAYAELGQVYEFLVPLKVQGAYESGQAAYQKAMDANPTNPTLPLLMARLEATDNLQGNLTDIEKLLNQSLTLKSNYADAFLFAEQLAVSQNDLPTATRAAEAVVSSNPQDPALWFQLGLFFYAGQDWADAQKAFQNAVSLESDYANAKYFLGLTDYKLNDTQDAIAQFSDLAASNPDNAEVKLILSNLQAGKDPFAGETPPQPSPEKRTTAPVKDATQAVTPQ